MSIEAINWVFELQDVTATEKFVLVAIANRANDKHEAWPSWTRLMKDTCLSRKSIYRILDSLIHKGYLIKTGDTIRQVNVYKICGVLSKENLTKLKSINKKLSTTSVTMTPVSPRNQCHHDTGTRVTMTPPPVSPRHLEPLIESKKESSGENSIFFDTKAQIKNQLIKHGLEPTEDITAQIEFYVDAKPNQPQDQTIRVAVSLHKKGQWKIPNGYQGITSQSIAEKDRKYEEQKKLQYSEEAQAYKNIITQLETRQKGNDNRISLQSTIIPKFTPEEEAQRETAKKHLADILSFLKPSYNKMGKLADE